MSKRVIEVTEDGSEAIVAYDESDEERSERIESSGKAASESLEMTPGQAKYLRKTLSEVRRSQRRAATA